MPASLLERMAPITEEGAELPDVLMIKLPACVNPGQQVETIPSTVHANQYAPLLRRLSLKVTPVCCVTPNSMLLVLPRTVLCWMSTLAPPSVCTIVYFGFDEPITLLRIVTLAPAAVD